MSVVHVRSVLPVVLVLLLSGCVSETPVEIEEDPPPTKEPLPTTQDLEIDHTGQAGDWIMIWAPYAYHADVFQLDGTERCEAEDGGSPNLAFFSRLDHVTVAPNETHWGDRGSGGMGVEASHQPISDGIDRETTVRSSNNITGMFGFFTANTPWTLKIDLTLSDAAFSEIEINHGEGTSFAYGGEQENGVRLPIGQVRLEADTQETGWTHIEFLSNRAQPNSEREIEVQFANGFQVSGETSTSGLCIVIQCSGGSNGAGNQFGVINNTAGPNMGQAEYREAGYGVDVAIVNLPGAQNAFPEVFKVTSYEKWSWPFTTPVPPPS